MNFINYIMSIYSILNGKKKKNNLLKKLIYVKN